MKIEALLPFLKEIDRLKQVDRQTLIHNGGRKENSAEHSWHLAVAVVIFQKFATTEIDLLKATTMALLHDLVEVDAGDTFIYADQTDKASKELATLARVTALLPVELGSDFRDLWIEFEECETAEAKYVSALDRFLPLYSNYLNEGHSWREHGISSERVVAKNKGPISTGIPQLWDLAMKMVDETKARKNF